MPFAVDVPSVEPALTPAPDLSVVIPIYNEEAILERSLRAMLVELGSLAASFELLLVENGSTDGTLALARRIAEQCAVVRVISVSVADYGAALRVGMSAARGATVVNFDIDYWDVPFLRDGWFLVRQRFDIVIGSKNLRLSSDQRSVIRRVVSQGFRLVLHLGFGLRVSDTHGIKVWRNSPLLRELIERVRFDHSLFDTELILRGQRAGLRIAELPVEVLETRRSPWGILRRIPRTLRDLLALRGALWSETQRRV